MFYVINLTDECVLLSNNGGVQVIGPGGFIQCETIDFESQDVIENIKNYSIIVEQIDSNSKDIKSNWTSEGF